jgi:hypothetical protein
MKKIIVLVLSYVLISLSAFADEGMWLPQLLQSLNEKKMKQQGMKISAEDIYSINKSSLKDAIVSFGGFCTAEVISDKGLILTNHHCGFDKVQDHSSLQNNYIRDGFWAKNFGEELPNPGLTATFIVRIDDVTADVLRGVPANAAEKDRQSAVDANIAALKKTAKKEAHQDMIIRPFFEGNKYFLFVTEVYKDVRLVGVPPSAIGNFGKDTDNWMWPRHTGDFSIFRIYAGKDNKPADYSPGNVPYVPKRSLNISLDGVEENDFTMVFGFPGRTYQYLPSFAVAQIMNVNDPAKIGIRKTALGILNEYMRKDEQIKIQYAAKYASIENAYKKWQGEILGLKRKDVVGKKQQYEAEFQKRVNANAEWKAKYGDLLNQLSAAYAQLEPIGFARDYHTEVTARLELITLAKQAARLVNAYQNNGANGYTSTAQKVRDTLSDLYRELNVNVDKRLFAALLQMYVQDQKPENIPAALQDQLKQANGDFNTVVDQLYAKTVLLDSASFYQLLSADVASSVNTLKNDPGYQMYVALQENYTKVAGGKLNEVQGRINSLLRSFMAAQMEVFKEKAFYPDANSTLRVTYGKAKSYRPRDGVNYGMYTYLDGVMEKYVPGDYEFDVPAKLRDLYAKKDFGRYGVNGKQPVCFIATNHTTGGNSGSPALDAYGNLIGLNFDRVWEGTMSDIYYDADICRNIMVDIRYVAFVIDKFAGAQNIINELKFVHPKKKK